MNLDMLSENFGPITIIQPPISLFRANMLHENDEELVWQRLGLTALGSKNEVPHTIYDLQGERDIHMTPYPTKSG